MNKVINKIKKIIYGRYGVDQLYSFLLILCLIIVIINTFINSIILRIIELVIFFYCIYRVFSKNKYKRSKENKKYLEIKSKIEKNINYQKKKYKDRNTHMYKKCPKCRQKIRLPLKKFKNLLKCQIFREKFEVKCRRNEKIKVEIIK